MYSDDDDPDWDGGITAPRSPKSPVDEGNEFRFVGEDDPNEDLRAIFSDEESEIDDAHEHELIPDYEHPDEPGTKKSKPKVKRVAPADRRLSPEVEQLLNECMEAYTSGEHETAIALAEKAIALDASAIRAYQMLAAIYEDMQYWDKVLTAKVAVAHLDKRDKEGWIEAARLSRDMGFQDQAIRFFQTAGRLDDKENPDQEVMMERVELYEHTQQYGRACEMLKKLRKLQPTDPQILVMMTHNLNSMHKTHDAIQEYEKLLHQNRTLPPRELENVQEFGWSELNILTELYIKQAQYNKGIRTIRQTTRWLLGREEENFWDGFRDDTEWIPHKRVKNDKFKRSPFKGDDKYWDMPIDIRTKLLTCRAKTRNIAESKEHLNFLLELGVDEYEDLYFEVAKVYLDVHEEDLALELLQKRYEWLGNEDPEYEMAPHFTRAHRALGNITEAIKWCKSFCDSDKRTIHSMVELTEMYQETQDIEAANEAYAEVTAMRESEQQEQQNRNKERVVEDGDDEMPDDEADTSAAAFIANKTRKPRTYNTRKNTVNRGMTRNEKIAAVERRRQETVELHAAYIKCQEQYNNGNQSILPQYRRRLGELWSIFSNHPGFFPKRDGGRPSKFTGELRNPGPGRKPKISEIEERINQVATKLHDTAIEDVIEETTDDSGKKKMPTEFRGLDFDQWFDVCMKHALLESQLGNNQHAVDVAAKARTANVFVSDNERVRVGQLVQLATVAMHDDWEAAYNILRDVFPRWQFRNDSYRMYSFLFPGIGGADSIGWFSTSNNQKYLKRQLKAVDQLVTGKPVDGAARVYDESVRLETASPVLLAVYGHIMLMGRSYVDSLAYVMRAKSLQPKDSMLLLTTGILYLHRSVQRQSGNRHLQVMEGLSYLFEYHGVRSKHGPGEAQEADYNLGRAFHMLALPSMAIKYYQRVIDHKVPDPAYDMTSDAAYNMHLIYAEAGNMRLARQVVDKYLVI